MPDPRPCMQVTRLELNDLFAFTPVEGFELELDGKEFEAFPALKHLCLVNMDIETFTVPMSLTSLTFLNLGGNNLDNLPKQLSVLTALAWADFRSQKADFQLSDPLDFLVGMTALETLGLMQGYGLNGWSGHAWTAESLQMIAEGEQGLRQAGRHDVITWHTDHGDLMNVADMPALSQRS